jgi:hypothetical protein
MFWLKDGLQTELVRVAHFAFVCVCVCSCVPALLASPPDVEHSNPHFATTASCGGLCVCLCLETWPSSELELSFFLAPRKLPYAAWNLGCELIYELSLGHALPSHTRRLRLVRASFVQSVGVWGSLAAKLGLEFASDLAAASKMR